MAKTVIRKKEKTEEKVVTPVVETAEVNIEDAEKETTKNVVRTKRQCAFCTAKKNPSYTDSAALKRYISDRSRIYPKAKTGLCAKHQRYLAKEIKHARHLALLPFVPSL